MLRAAASQLSGLAQQAVCGTQFVQQALGGATSTQARRGFNFIPYVIESTSRGEFGFSARDELGAVSTKPPFTP